MAIAVLSDGYALDVFHHKIRSAKFCSTSIVDVSDVDQSDRLAAPLRP